MTEFQEYLKLAMKCALRGGEIIQDGFYRNKEVEFKSFANPVTEYDRRSEEAIVNLIHGKYPEHSILTEEGLSSSGKLPVKWVIDPLDGTVNFTHQIPFVCVSIGVEVAGEIAAGVIYAPILGELYYASRGGGAYLNKKKIRVSGISDKAKSLLVTGFPYEREGRNEILAETIKAVNKSYTGFRRLGSAAMDLAYTARGSFEGFYEENLKPWDTAAGKILVEEAGGRLTDYQGGDYSIYKKTIVASNGLVHAGMIDFLKDIPNPD